MAGDIEDFLRRAAAKRAQRQQDKPRPEIEIIEPEPAAPEPIQRKPLRPAAPVKQPDVVQPFPIHEGVDQHVARHLDTGEFRDRASHMAEQVGLADEKVEAHLHEVFDHRVGALDRSDEFAGDQRRELTGVQDVGQDDVSRVAAEITNMLRSAKSIRQAVLLQEILKRPDY